MDEKQEKDDRDPLDDLLSLIDRMDPECESFLRLSWEKPNEYRGPKDQLVLKLNTGERERTVWVPIAVRGAVRTDVRILLAHALNHMLFNLPQKLQVKDGG